MLNVYVKVLNLSVLYDSVLVVLFICWLINMNLPPYDSNVWGAAFSPKHNAVTIVFLQKKLEIKLSLKYPLIFSNGKGKRRKKN